VGWRQCQSANSTPEVESILEEFWIAEALKRQDQLPHFVFAGCKRLRIFPEVSLLRIRQYRPLRVELRTTFLRHFFAEKFAFYFHSPPMSRELSATGASDSFAAKSLLSDEIKKSQKMGN